MVRRSIIIPYRRKREGRTDYRKRLLLVQSGLPRLVVRKSLKNVLAQIIEYSENGDKVKVCAHSKELKGYGWEGYGRNTASAYLVGLLCGVKAKSKGISDAVLDTGRYVSSRGAIIYAVLKGALDAGLNVPHNEDLFPEDERLKGKHLKKGAESFEQVKAKILQGGSK